MVDNMKSSGFNSAAEEAPQTHSNWHAQPRPLAKSSRELELEALLRKTNECISLYIDLSEAMLKGMILPHRENILPVLNKTNAMTKEMLATIDAKLAEK